MLAVGLDRCRSSALPDLGLWVSFVPSCFQFPMGVGYLRNGTIRRTHQIHFQEASPISEVRTNHTRVRQEVARS